jgi:hypothetical protein
MEGAKKPFWEESYKRKGKLDTFGGGKPSKEVYDAAKKKMRLSDFRTASFLQNYQRIVSYIRRLVNLPSTKPSAPNIIAMTPKMIYPA